jgi:hypothetical protein
MPFRRRQPTADVRRKVPTPTGSIRGRGGSNSQRCLRCFEGWRVLGVEDYIEIGMAAELLSTPLGSGTFVAISGGGAHKKRSRNPRLFYLTPPGFVCI